AVVQLAARLLRVDAASATTAQLTEAEAGVLALVREGLTNAQIARRRRSSPHTVANQVATLLRKLGLPSRRAATALPLG
ncbi:MAG TPA: LuxR C-terminal-related transcriptional regulator, partial [Polyangiaceae bacterium]